MHMKLDTSAKPTRVKWSQRKTVSIHQALESKEVSQVLSELHKSLQVKQEYY